MKNIPVVLTTEQVNGRTGDYFDIVCYKSSDRKIKGAFEQIIFNR
jgi:hypothetical protein